jgi:hypothetical protein
MAMKGKKKTRWTDQVAEDIMYKQNMERVGINTTRKLGVGHRIMEVRDLYCAWYIMYVDFKTQSSVERKMPHQHFTFSHKN